MSSLVNSGKSARISAFREVEFHDFANDGWLAVDLAELACRN
jgi:hypothetical protein